MNDVSNKAERPAVATATKRHNLLRRPATQWWRLTPATAFDEVALRKMRASLSKIDMLGEPRWKDAASGDASASIRIALGLLPANAATLRCDLAMTALAVCAAEGNSAACLVMSHLLRQLPGAGNAEARIATSWLVRAFGKVLRRRAHPTGTETEGAAMKVQIMSDLHIDYPGARGFPPLAPGASIVIVAGDTCQGLVQAVEAQRRAYPNVEVVTVAGNHEYYRYCLPAELEAGRIRARELGVHLLENDSVVLFGRLRVIGATGWTDYELFGAALRAPAMRAAADGMQDHKRITWRKQPWQRFRPEEARALHLQSRAFIDAELAKLHDGPSLVLTHHAGAMEAIAPEFQQSLLSAAYASELLPLVDRHQPQWWVSGHTHTSMDFRRGRTRMISNPCGYADENPYFDPLFTIEVDHD